MNPSGIILMVLMLLGGCAHTRWTPPSIEVPSHWSASVQAPAHVSVRSPKQDARRPDSARAQCGQRPCSVRASAPQRIQRDEHGEAVQGAPLKNARAARAQHPNVHWWTSFNDPHLTTLIEEALVTNHDLAAAAIRVQRARLQADLGNPFIQLNVQADAHLGVSRPLNAPSTTTRSESARLSGSLSHALDIWGRQARRRAMTAWEAQATEADRAQTLIHLIGTVAELYWQLVRLNERMADGEADLQNAQKILSIVQTRYAAGAISGVERARAEQNVWHQKLARTQLRQQRIETQHALAVLLNRPPHYRFAAPKHLSDALLPPIPAGLPVEVLKRRPDLKAAELRLRQSFADIEETRTRFYPGFTLTAGLGTASTALLGVLHHPIASLGAGLTLPFMQWHTMRLEIKVSQSEYEEAVVHFRQKLYQALSEVEDALSRRTQLIEQAAQQQQIVWQAERIEAQAQAQFKAGATGIQPWLETQTALRLALNALRDNRLAQLNHQMKLYQALGGG